MKILSGDSTERANVLCIVNPCNPTGDYMPLDQIKTWINDNVYDGGFVIVGKLFVINGKYVLEQKKNRLIWVLILRRVYATMALCKLPRRLPDFTSHICRRIVRKPQYLTLCATLMD